MDNKRFSWESYGQLLHLPSNSLLFRQGDLGTGFYYLKEGEIKISIVSDNGDERLIDYCYPGELIGEHGIHESSYLTTAETTIDSRLYYFSLKSFSDLCTNVPEAAEDISLSLTSKVRMLMDIKSILNAPVEVQLAHLFNRFYEKTGKSEIPLSQTTISNFVGMSRVTVWKKLKEWRRENIITISDRIIYLHDIEKIRHKLKLFI
ncbi:Crp/Fnr family transcriptional regulator [Neobacillus sp. NPDC097160]|uniref:Crp/Fnr family transcriptional regulator n=1 Tax=Neobacillus sp. NPDC097160 TaxID=3364298 RepID=UPI00382C0B54